MDKEWKIIRNKVLARCENKCEVCGVPHQTKIVRIKDNPIAFAAFFPLEGKWKHGNANFIGYADGFMSLGRHLRSIGASFDSGIININLRICHKDFDKNHNALDNLIALCPKHYMEFMGDKYAESRARNKMHRWLQLPLPTDNQYVNENGEVEEDLWADMLPKELG